MLFRSLIREEITKLGYNIADEKIIKDSGVFYEIIKFIRADKAIYGDKDIEFGPILRNEKSATFKEKYQSRITEINKLLDNKDLPKGRAIELSKEKERIESVL